MFCFSLFLGVPKATFRDFWGCTPAMAWTQNLLGLCFFGCGPDAAFLCFAWWLQFRSGWGTISLFLGGPKATRFHCFLLFLGVPKATFRDFWGCTPAMAWTQNLLGLCFSGCAPDAAFLGFAWWLQFRSGWGTISLFLGVRKATSQWLRHDFIVFRGSKSNTFSLFFIVFRGVPKATFRDFWGCTPAMAWTQNLLGRCFSGCAPDAAFLGFAWWLQFRSGWGTISLFLGVPKATRFHCFSLFLGVPKATFRDFWGCTPAMAWTQNLLGLCFSGCAPDAAFLGFAWWLQFRSGWGAISLSLGVPKATRFHCFVFHCF